MANKSLIFYVFFLLLLTQVNAFGLASGYLPNNTMLLKPGESKTYVVELQNNDPNELKMDFVISSDIVEIINKKESYIVGNKTRKVNIILNITMPINVTKESIYEISYYAIPLEEGNGNVQLNLKLNRKLSVVPLFEENKNNRKTFNFSYVLIGLITIGFIFILFRKNLQIIKKLLKK